jgi:hypothetical protein
MNEQEFNKYIEENKGYVIFDEYFHTLSPSQNLEAYNNARKNNDSFELLTICFSYMEIWQRNETLEDALEQKRGADLFYSDIWFKLTPSQKGKVLKSIAKNNQYDYKMLGYARLRGGTPKNHRQKFYKMVFSSILKNENHFPVEFFSYIFDILNEKQKKQGINKGLESENGYKILEEHSSFLDKKQKLKGVISLIKNKKSEYPETELKNIFVLYYNDFDKKSQSIIIDELVKSRYNYILLGYDILSREQGLKIIESIVENKNLNEENLELLEYHFNKLTENQVRKAIENSLNVSFYKTDRKLKLLKLLANKPLYKAEFDIFFEELIKENEGSNMLYCREYLKGEYRKKAFNNAIKNNKGYDMIITSNYNLSKDEFELAYENALKNRCGKRLLLNCSSSYKLTEEQIKRCREQI